MSLREISEKIIDLTNGGLDIITEFYPQANTRNNFRIREDDQNPSASLYKRTSEDRYRLNDFGGNMKSQDCFGVWMSHHNCDYWEAIIAIARKLQSERGVQLLNEKTNVYKFDYREWKIENRKIEGLPVELNTDGYFYKVRPFTEDDFKIFGPEITRKTTEGKIETLPLITEDICNRVGLVALEEFYRTNKEETKVMMFRENETFPIYAFINENNGKEWLKIYMPKGKKSLQPDGKDFRFQHLGSKQANFIYGLEEIRKSYNENCEKAAERYEEELVDMKENPDAYSTEDVLKLKDSIAKNQFQFERICIATGGSDGLNLMALGELVIWKNSETDHLSQDIMDELFKMAKEVVNIPDLDSTGKHKGRDFALEFIDAKTFWIDDFTDRAYVKDFKDYVTTLKHLPYSKLVKEVKKNIELSMPAKFWVESFNEKTRKTTYTFNKVFGNYFLRLNGFLRIDDDSRKDGYYFAKINGHIVEELKNTQPIKDFFKNFLLSRQKKVGKRIIPFDLINTMINNGRMTDSDLASLHNRNLDFTDYDSQSQYLFFTDKIWKISRNGTHEVRNFKNYVLKSQLIDELIYNGTGRKINTRLLKIDENGFKEGEKDQYGNPIPEKKPYFNITSQGEDLYGIHVIKKDCDIFNFLIQTSRVHWEAEKAEWVKRGHKEEDFLEKTKFQIRSPYLTEEQNQEQESHLVNKIFTIGYTGHRFKDSSRPWVPWGVDNAVSEDKVAEGGSGKGLFYSMFSFIMNVFVVNGKSEFDKDRFWLENVNKHTDLIFIDDVKRFFSMEFLYQITTGNMEKDTKNVSKETINKKDSPKVAVASNYALRDMNGSSIRRRLLISFSDMYHSKNEMREERNPTHDFGYNLYEDWDDKQWFSFINFIAQCISFYLGMARKIEAPDNNIMRRSWLTEMGEEFREWADVYFVENAEREIPKFHAEDAAKAYAKDKNYVFLAKMTANTFKSKTLAWAKYNGYELKDRISRNMELPVTDDRGNYIPGPDGKAQFKRTTKEHIMLCKKVIDEGENPLQDEDLI